MTKLAKQSCILTVLLFLVCIIGRLCMHSAYTAYVPISHMYQAFRRAKGPAFYAYSTIHTAGFSLFLLLTGLMLLIATIRHLLTPEDFPYETLSQS